MKINVASKIHCTEVKLSAKSTCQGTHQMGLVCDIGLISY